MNIHSPTSTLSHQQSSPISNQVRLISSSHGVPSSSYIAGNINLAQTAPASVFSSYQQQPILVPPHPNLSTAPLVQSFSTPSSNGVLKDRHNQQAASQLDKRTRSFKEPLGVKLSTLNEAQALPAHEGQVSLGRIRSALTNHFADLEQRTIDTCLDANAKAKGYQTQVQSLHRECHSFVFTGKRKDFLCLLSSLARKERRREEQGRSTGAWTRHSHQTGETSLEIRQREFSGSFSLSLSSRDFSTRKERTVLIEIGRRSTWSCSTMAD